MALLFILSIGRFAELGSSFRAFILIGLLGGYTTFSAFSLETINLFENGDWSSALCNIFASIFICMAATWLGILGRRQL